MIDDDDGDGDGSVAVWFTSLNNVCIIVPEVDRNRSAFVFNRDDYDSQEKTRLLSSLGTKA
jgi:hypothetical protein